jgi:hypothetical protein
MWRMPEIVRWDGDDAIAHDPPRMRIINLTQLHRHLCYPFVRI